MDPLIDIGLLILFIVLMVLFTRWIIGTNHIISLLKKQNNILIEQAGYSKIIADVLSKVKVTKTERK